MAKIYQNDNPLQIESTRQKQMITILWLSYFMAVYIINSAWFIGVGFFVVSLLTIFSYRKIRVTRYGLAGEKQTLSFFRSLPPNYYVFSNLYIEFGDKISETDFVIVGKKGVFVVEVKNYRGKITGREDDKEWIQHKISKKGYVFTNKMYNPTKQVSTHVWRLSNLLKERVFMTWVQGIVWFVNDDCEIHVDSSKIPVLHANSDFGTFLESYEPRTELSDEEIEKIAQFLRTLI